MKRCFVFLLITVALVIGGAVFFFRQRCCAPCRRSGAEIRALWISRFEYASPEDVRAAVSNAARWGFTDLFFQVRGNGTVCYAGKLEPWSGDISGAGAAATGRDPGWDPLQVACRAAADCRIRLHAWVNVLPGWSGSRAPPEEARQLWTAHRDWFMVNDDGRVMEPLPGWYAFLNPVLPAVRKHLCAIAAEICRYPVAGIHFDYLRYPADYRLAVKREFPNASAEEIRRRSEFLGDAVSRKEMLRRFGPHPSPRERARFRGDAIDRLLDELTSTIRRNSRYPIILSVAVKPEIADARRRFGQRPLHWLREGWADWIVPMNYSADRFRNRLIRFRREAGCSRIGADVVMGINAAASPQIVIEEIRAVRRMGCRGFAIFSYGMLFDDRHRPRPKSIRVLDEIRVASP